jgi:hypothetical protein
MSHLVTLRLSASDPGLLREAHWNVSDGARQESLDDICAALDAHKATKIKMEREEARQQEVRRLEMKQHREAAEALIKAERVDWGAGWPENRVFNPAVFRPQNLRLLKPELPAVKEDFQGAFRNIPARSSLLPFGGKPWDDMSPGEQTYALRLEKTLSERRALASREALLDTTGYVKKERIEAQKVADAVVNSKAFVKAGDRVAGCFSDPAPNPVGSRKMVDDLTLLTVPSRSLSHQRNFITGGSPLSSPHSVKYWRPPPPGLKGTNKTLREIENVTLPRGIRRLRLQETRDREAARTTSTRGRTVSFSQSVATLKLSSAI